MKNTILLLLIFSLGVFAQANRKTVDTALDDWHNTNFNHAYLFFEDSSATITATKDIWYTITNATDSLWGESDVDGITSENDSLYFIRAGHYEGIAAIFFVGANKKSGLKELVFVKIFRNSEMYFVIFFHNLFCPCFIY